MPSNRTFFIESMGCAGNRADTAQISKFLHANNWKPDSIEKADLVILNTCAFTAYHEDKALQRINSIRSRMKKEATLVVAGCLNEISPGALNGIPCVSVGPRSIQLFDEIAAPISVPIHTISSAVAEKYTYTIRIATGCLGKCTYCAIPAANGVVKSVSVDVITKQIQEQYELGTTTFKLTSEDVAAYGYDRQTTIIELLSAISKLRLPVKIFLDNLNPNWALRYLDDLIPFFTSELLSDHIYIPFQSGSDRILRLMKRRYTANQVLELFVKLYEIRPSVKIATDIMVGFPSETERDYQKSVALYRKFPFHFVELFAYQDRKGTVASRMDGKLSEEIKKLRQEGLVAEVMNRFMQERDIKTKEDLIVHLDQIKNFPININCELI